mmetsp:Transcript_114171/g.179737  ORF Transcript_114171/g.179737 Transcript_114171/m.179737 type:complete len:147 (-) Transcript_114171:80-520(-)
MQRRTLLVLSAFLVHGRAMKLESDRKYTNPQRALSSLFLALQRAPRAANANTRIVSRISPGRLQVQEIPREWQRTKSLAGKGDGKMNIKIDDEVFPWFNTHLKEPPNDPALSCYQPEDCGEDECEWICAEDEELKQNIHLDPDDSY